MLIWGFPFGPGCRSHASGPDLNRLAQQAGFRIEDQNVVVRGYNRVPSWTGGDGKGVSAVRQHDGIG